MVKYCDTYADRDTEVMHNKFCITTFEFIAVFLIVYEYLSHVLALQ